jgi:serine/alanine adding enzyme
MEIRVNESLPEIALPPFARWPRLAAHHPAWNAVMVNGLGHKPFNLAAFSDSGSLVGILPLSFVRSPLFGKFLVSQPYLNTGGVWADEEEVAVALVDQAVRLADQLDVKHLELRHEVRLDHPKLNAERTDKVHMRLALPASSEELLKSFKSKLRSQIKKGAENPFEIEFGGEKLLPQFYGLFAHNMRDLGTPVYSRGLFRSILTAFGGDRAELAVVRLHGTPVAGALLVHDHDRTEVPSASSLRQFNATGANMWMYWRLLERAIERGSTTFDFGRSSIGSGTYKFKEQWGAVAYPAVWQYYVRRGNPADMRPDSPNKQRLISIWQRLPVWLTKFIGPSIVRGIP